MANRWKIEISHYQQFDNDMTTPGIYAVSPYGGFFMDTNNGAGITDPLSNYANYWLEVNPDEVNGLDIIQITYKLKSDNELSNPDGTNYVFALVDSVAFFSKADNAGTAYNFIKDWLIDDPTAPNNSIAVKLTHLECESIVLTDINIGLNQIKWDSDTCLIECDMKEIQPNVSCFERTLIDDNHQGWFWEETTKNHPRFKYCNKVTPYLILLLMSIFNSIMWPFLLLEAMINSMIAAINIALNLLGANPIAPFTPVSDLVGDLLKNIVGCNYEHPAPLVRDYFKNVCDKCGLTYNSSEDIFNSTTLSYALNDGLDPVYGTDNPYYNTVMFYPLANRKGMKTGKNDKRWQMQYSPGFTGFSYAEELKKIFNSEWRIYQNEFCFYKKGQGNYINAYALVFDFTTGPDAALLLNNGFVFEWDLVQRSAYMRGVYAEADAFDTNQANTNERWNSIVDFNKNKNPNFKGEKYNISEYFAATQFRFDNTERDYILDGLIGVWGAINGAAPAGIQAQIDAVLGTTPIHAILLESMQVEKPRLMIWDPALSGDDDYPNSNSYSAYYTITNFGVDPTTFNTGYIPDPDAGGYTYPAPDPYYNAPIGIYPYASYSREHLPQYDTQYWDEYYVYSFPLHFDEKFKYNLYENFYKEDDPQYIPLMRITTKCEIKACCAVFQSLGINGSGNIKLNCKVRVPADQDGNYYDMWIYEIKYSAETNSIELTLHTNKYN